MNAAPLLTIRASDELLARLDRVAVELSTLAQGAPVNRSSVARLALERGLDALEAQTRGSARKRKR